MVCVLPADWDLGLETPSDAGWIFSFFWQELLVESSVFLSREAPRPAVSAA